MKDGKITFADVHKRDPVVPKYYKRAEFESVAKRMDVVKFLLEQLRLRGVVGLSLSGPEKDRMGFPDVVYGEGGKAVAVWVFDPQFGVSGEARLMMKKMEGQWKRRLITNREEGMKLLSGKGFFNNEVTQ